MDADHPRVKPSVPGTQTCMRCGWRFVSPDPVRLRRCADCKHGDENTYTPRTGVTAQVYAAARACRENA